MLSTVLLMLAATGPAEPISPRPIPTLEETTTRIERNDAQLFWGFFEGCDPEAVADLVHPDFRMLHDLAGMPITSGADMLAQSREQCAARGPGGRNEGYRNRRLLVPGSRTVKMLGDWGAIEEGYHTFYEWRSTLNDGAGGWELTGGGRYIHSWQWMAEEGRYRLLESLSLEHGAAKPYPPAE